MFSLLGEEDPFERRTARELGERALEMARDLDDQRLLSETLRFVASTETEATSSRATLLGQEALEGARRLEDPVLVGDALLILARAAPTAEEKRELRLETLACYRRARDVLSVSLALQGLASQAVADGQVAAARAYREEAIAAAEEIGSSWYLPALWSDQGIVFLLLGEFEEAASFSRKALIAFRRLGGRSATAFSIFVLACCATGTGDYCRAARLTGVHDVIDAEVIDLVHKGIYQWTPPEQRARDDNRARLRQILGDDEYEREHTLGRGLSFVQAVDLALGRASSS
jgi:tetratricopeptide (TPR) repeat protein